MLLVPMYLPTHICANPLTAVESYCVSASDFNIPLVHKCSDFGEITFEKFFFYYYYYFIVTPLSGGH